MGHYRSEMSPAESEDHYSKRLHKLRGKLKDVSLGEFTVSELESLMRLMSLLGYKTSSLCGDVRDSDFETLEQVVSRKKKSVRKRKKVARSK